jgi:hypothetical protein
VQRGGINHDQALRLLDQRWHSPDTPAYDASKEGKLLIAMGDAWPSEFSVDAYNNHFNLAVSRASRSHLNPLDDSPASMELRSIWWGVFADPPVLSPYFTAAQEARAVTGQAKTTTAHRAAWHAAMSTSIATYVKAGVGKPVGGLARGQVAARYGGLYDTPGLEVDASAAAARPGAFPPGDGGGPPRNKPCARCPVRSDGQKVVHDRGFKCAAAAECTGCGSITHLHHSCWVLHGVPAGAKIPAGLHDEVSRLHRLHLEGKFDWMTTPTTLRWMDGARLKKGATAKSVAASFADAYGDEMEAEMAYIHSCGYQPLPSPEALPAPLPTPADYPGVVGGSVAATVSHGVGVSDVYRSMLAFDGIVGGHSASTPHVHRALHDHEWHSSHADCGSCGGDGGQQCDGCSASWCSCSGLVVPPPRGVPAPGPVTLPAPPPASPPTPFVPPTSAPRFAPTAHPGVETRMVAPAVVGGGGGSPHLLALPCIMRVVMWGLLVLMMVVPVWAWLVRTDHRLLDSACAVMATWSPRFYALLVLVWQYVMHLHCAVVGALPMATVAVGLLGVLAGDAVTTLVRSELAAAALALGAVRRNVMRVPQRVPWLALLMLGVMHMVQSAPPSLSVASPALNLPSVVSCSYSIGALTGGIVNASSPTRAMVGAMDARAASGGEGAPWAARLPYGTWVVDSGAELLIAGAFIYPNSTIVERRPDVSIKGVEGKLTPVDNVVRSMTRLPDGEYCMSEILVCDDFQIALWSTEYMACFGFSALLMPSGEPSVVRTPSGCNVTLEHRPYRIHAPCRKPTPLEFRTCASAVQPSAPSLPPPPSAARPPVPLLPPSPPLMRAPLLLGAPAEAVALAADGAAGAAAGSSAVAKAPLRDVTEAEAWLLHGSLMHAGWRTISETCRVRIPPMPRCPTCELTKSKRLPQPGHDIKSTFAGQLTHSDTWGPFCCALYWKGCRYIVVFVDDWSRVRLPVFCKDRTTSTLLSAYKVWHAFMTSLGCPPNGTWQSDGGPEYVSDEAFDFCDEHAIQRLLSVRYVPTGNGVAESAFRVYIPRSRAACRGSGAPKEAYALAYQHSLWLANRTWSKQLGGRPFDRVPSPPPASVEQFMDKPFGCRMWAHLPHVNVPHKMADTAREGCFMGMSEIYKGVVFYDPLTHDFDASIHARFDPGVMPMLDMTPPPSDPAPLPPSLPLPPLFVPSTVPVVAPVIPPVPALALPLPTPARPPVLAAPRGRPPARRPMFAPSLLLPAAPPQMPPLPQRILPPPPLLPPPPQLPPPPPAELAPRRAGSQWQQLRHDEQLRRAASTLADGPDTADSLSAIVAWLASTWHPPYVAASTASSAHGSTHVAVIIFSGVESPLPECLRARGARVIAVDVAVGGRLHDLTDVTPDGIGWHLRRAAQRGEVHSLHAAVPCETFSVSLDDSDMVRSWPDHSMGMPRLTHAKASKLFLSNSLVYFTIDLATDVYRTGGEVTIENPSPRMDMALPHVFWAAKAHHANLFRTPPMLEFAEATGSSEITLPLCACGMDMQKYVTVLATRGAARVLAPLHGLVCTHEGHTEHAYGLTTAGARGGLQSARYPYVFCVVLACAHLRLTSPGVDSSGTSPRIVPTSLGAVDKTGLPHMLTDTDHGVARSLTGWLFMFGGAAVSWAVRGQTLPSLSSAESELYGLRGVLGGGSLR